MNFDLCMVTRALHWEMMLKRIFSYNFNPVYDLIKLLSLSYGFCTYFCVSTILIEIAFNIKRLIQ